MLEKPLGPFLHPPVCQRAREPIAHAEIERSGCRHPPVVLDEPINIILVHVNFGNARLALPDDGLPEQESGQAGPRAVVRSR